jgi:hypothetical protein
MEALTASTEAKPLYILKVLRTPLHVDIPPIETLSTKKAENLNQDSQEYQ